MFRKCLKYDLKAFYKIWLIAAAVMLAVAALGGIGFGNYILAAIEMEAESTDTWTTVWNIARILIGMLAYVVVLYTLAIFNAGTSILMLIRYYRHFFTDQGYLTFTLPVKRSTLFCSKAASAFIYSMGTYIVTLLSFLVIAVETAVILLLFSPEIRTGILPSFAELPNLFLNVDLSWALSSGLYSILFIILIGFLTIAICFASWMSQYFVITIAATLFRKLKILSVIVAYYVVNNIIIVPIAYIGVYYVIFLLMFGAIGFASLFTAFPLLVWSLIYLLLLLFTVAFVAFGLVFAYLSIQRLERKLNLA